MISLEQLEEWIDALEEQYQREQDQAILQRNMDKAIYAMAGKDACIRLRNHFSLRQRIDSNVRAISHRKRRA